MTAIKKLLVPALTLTVPLFALAQAPAQPAEPAKPAAESKPPPAPPPAVQVYGTLNVNLHYEDMGDATTGVNVSPRFVVSVDSSNVGVRGTLKLSEMASAVYQCETGANVDGEANVALCNRNSRIGLSGIWGTLAFGNWDTPMKAQHYGTKADDPFGNTDVFGFQGIMGSPGYQVKTGSFGALTPNPNPPTGTAANTVASFDLRGANSVLWFSPKVMGASARLQWGVDELRGVNGQVNPTLLGAGVTFEQGIFALVGALEYHEDAFGLQVINGAPNNTAAPAKDWAWRISAGADLPLGVGALNVMAMLEQLTYKQDDAPATAGAFKDYSRMAWLLGAKVRMGPHELRARYSMALKPDITAASGTTLAANAKDDLGAQQIALGYAYFLAKSTQVYLSATQIINEARARYTFGVQGSTVVTTGSSGTPAGADLLAVGLGMRHAF